MIKSGSFKTLFSSGMTRLFLFLFLFLQLGCEVEQSFNKKIRSSSRESGMDELKQQSEQATNTVLFLQDPNKSYSNVKKRWVLAQPLHPYTDLNLTSLSNE